MKTYCYLCDRNTECQMFEIMNFRIAYLPKGLTLVPMCEICARIHGKKWSKQPATVENQREKNR